MSRSASRPFLVVYTLFKGRKDAKIIRMAVDTGATTTIIPPEVAIAIGCDPSRTKKREAIITASGIEYLPVVTIPMVACLGQRVRSLAVVCHDLPPQSIVDGLLGLDFLVHVPAFQQFQKTILKLTRE